MARATVVVGLAAVLGVLGAGCGEPPPTVDCRDGVFEGDVRIRSAAEAAQLSSCSSIAGSLFIGRSALPDLEALSALRTVDGSVSLTGNSALRSLDGLRSLRSIGGCLELNRNPLLEDLDGLTGLEAIGTCIVVGQDDEIGDDFGNDQLRSIDGLAGVAELDRFVIVEGNPRLADLAGLGSLRAIGGDLSIRRNPSLATLAGLAELRHVGGERVVVADNGALPSCEAEALATRLAAEGYDGEVAIAGNDEQTGCEP